MAEYIAEDGTIITEEMIDSWVEEIEQGFPNTTIIPLRGRVWQRAKAGEWPLPEPMKPRAIRMTDQLWKRVKEMAKSHGMDTSSYVRQALARALTEDARKAASPAAE